MKTVIHKEIDGIDIVIGFGKLQVNPVGTRKRFDEKLKQLKEYKEMQELSRDYVKYRYQKDATEKELNAKLEKIKNKKEEVISKMHQDMDHLNFFEPKKDEKALSEKEHDEYKAMYEAAKKNKNYLTIDKKETKNLKGREYFLRSGSKITRHVIDVIGKDFPSGAIEEITNDERISILSPEAREEEYKQKKKSVIQKTKNKAIELMLDGKTEKEASDLSIQEFRPIVDQLKSEYNQV